MKALAYLKNHNLSEFQISEMEVKEPQLKQHDILVRIKAISFNPVDYKIRQNRASQNNEPVIIGWDASGVIEKIGSNVQNFKIGDEVYYSGDLTRAGSYAELQAVDSRLVSLKPKKLDFKNAASLPLTSLTAWEALFERGINYTEKSTALIIGGAGGVGSIAIQLLKAKTKAKVVATASRPETVKWVKDMGADVVINHHDLQKELSGHNISEVDVIFSTTHTENYLDIYPQILRPFGHLAVIDDPKTLDIRPFKQKALNVHWEFMFAKSMYAFQPESQGQILTQVAELVDTGKIKPTANKFLQGFNADNIRQAHTLLESSSSIGKIVLEF